MSTPTIPKEDTTMSDHDDMRRDMMEERFTRSVNAATCGGQGGGCHNPLCLDCNPQDPEPECGRPCDPAAAYEECEGYWMRMESEGLWNREGHHWTEKGWNSITRIL